MKEVSGGVYSVKSNYVNKAQEIDFVNRIEI